MGRAYQSGSSIEAGVLSLLQTERKKALSPREWKFRLAGYGYMIEEINGAQVVKSITRGVELGVIPRHLV
ncbi:MAG: hypothetical protein AAFR45_02210 [Pseudomonadota bacterium]